jgi:hypothetical protein
MQLRRALPVPITLLLALGCRESPPPAPPPPPPAPAAAPAPSAATATDGDAYFSVIEPHFARVSIYLPPAEFLAELDKTPEKPRHLLAAHWGVAEISNGGFAQLFGSSAGMLVPEAIVALRAIGLPENADLMAEAAGIFGKSYPREHDKRRRALAVWARKGKSFADLDEKFFAALKAHPGGFDAVAAAYAGR